MIVRSLRSGRIYEALALDGELLVSVVTPAPGDGVRAGDTFVLGHGEVEPLPAAP